MKRVYIILAVVVLVAMGIGVYMFRSAQANDDFRTLRTEGLAFYQAQNPGLTNLTARVIDYGCHKEIEILHNGQRRARVGWAGPGSYYVIGP